MREPFREFWSDTEGRDGCGFSLLRLSLFLVGIPLIVVHQLLKLPFKSLDRFLGRLASRVSQASNFGRILWKVRTPAFTTLFEHMWVELWVVMLLFIMWAFVLQQLTSPSPILPVLLLAYLAVARLGEILYTLLMHHIPVKRAQISVGRSLFLAVLNIVEVAVIFASLLVANGRLKAQILVLPSVSTALDASFSAIFTARFEPEPEWDTVIPNGVLSGVAFGVTLFILIVVLAQIINFGQQLRERRK
jgi:hypothetical protein